MSNIIKGIRINKANISSNEKYPNLEMGMGSNLTISGKFCYAPDLLRYCSPTVSVNNLFNACGPSKHSFKKSEDRYKDISIITHYGLKGRLVPYTF